jgi:hypothetical protein
MYLDFNVLVGKTLASIQVEDTDDDYIIFNTTDGSKYMMYHDQECCESVTIEDICGNLDNLIGSPILMAEERTEYGSEDHDDRWFESSTFTFYEIATNKGSVTIRWFGESNGYYSESVDFKQII